MSAATSVTVYLPSIAHMSRAYTHIEAKAPPPVPRPQRAEPSSVAFKAEKEERPQDFSSFSVIGKLDSLFSPSRRCCSGLGSCCWPPTHTHTHTHTHTKPRTHTNTHTHRAKPSTSWAGETAEASFINLSTSGGQSISINLPSHLYISLQTCPSNC